MEKKIEPPKFCPNCGASVTVVRHITGTMYEVMCQSCDQPAVISVNDSVKLPSDK